jgi:hypothetical protein
MQYKKRSGRIMPEQQSTQVSVGKDLSDQEKFLRETADELKKNTPPPPALDVPERPADDHVVISSSGTVITRLAPANDTAKSGTTLQIGDIERDGDHKGEIYGGVYPADNKPIWFQAAPKVMDHYKAAAWAEGQGGSLPTRKQGDYLTTLKNKGGAFTEIFNRCGSFPAGYVWLAEPLTYGRNHAWCQRLSYGDQYNYYRTNELPVLSVRR